MAPWLILIGLTYENKASSKVTISSPSASPLGKWLKKFHCPCHKDKLCNRANWTELGCSRHAAIFSFAAKSANTHQQFVEDSKMNQLNGWMLIPFGFMAKKQSLGAKNKVCMMFDFAPTPLCCFSCLAVPSN